MNKRQFESSFVLSPLAARPLSETLSQSAAAKAIDAQKDKLVPAAVLIPMVERHNKLFVILTQRAAHLKHHPGQVSFPGGRFEHADDTLINTALRETHEEVGIKPGEVQIIGQLQTYQTISQYVVTPFVGFVNADYQLILDKNEVDDAFEVPWAFFLNRDNHHQMSFKRLGQQRNVHFMPFENRFIWGTTAAMLHDLVSHFE
ncbi:MAG: 8-oxo-dGTP pyrophosphatase MutT (NUDIX family) [Alteromonadaceae bacterium]|jgi:8-oxo-dGTP pyrophosphatase MutT (NUDIX family)